MKKILSFAALLVMLCFSAYGQDEGVLSTTNKKAIKHYHEAQQYFDARRDSEAAQSLLLAIKEDTNFIEAHGLLGYAYEEMNRDEDAIAQFRIALSINPHFFPNLFFTLGKLDLGEGHYDEALRCLKHFQQHGTTDESMKWYTTLFISDCEFAQNAIKHPVPFNPQNMGDAINTPLNEYFPSITTDGETFLFTRRMPDEESMPPYQEDLYYCIKVNGQWTTAVPTGYPLNTPHFNEGAPTLSADGKLLIYASDRPDGYGSVDLYFSVRVGNHWTQGRNLGPPVNTMNWESQPCLSTDGRTLYFIRGDKYADAKTQDIYMTQLNDSNYWSTPVRLSDTINTPGREECPFIAADNQTLYFCSDGHPGMGGTDIFISRRKPDGSWGTPKDLGYPINSSKDETGIIVDPNGQLAYFSSDREGGKGGLDIYQFALYDSIKPTPVTYMKGMVYDAKTKQPLAAGFNLIDLNTGKEVVRSASSFHDGSFLVCIPLNRNYALNVSKKGYLFYSANFLLKDSNTSSIHPYMMNIPLQLIDTGASIVLKNVFFPTNKYDLKPESQIELDKLVAFLKLNATVKIEISGHTDNVGKALSNKLLSENRAKAVYNYLVAHGIDAGRLTYKGYGQTRPIAGNDTEEGRALNRRTEMKIVGK